MDMDDLDTDPVYLQPDFDPSSLTVPKLRNTLMHHDIPYPSSAKKSQLVDVFEQQLRPKAKRILAQRAKIRRTSRGITDMPSQEGSLADADEEEEEQVPTRRSTRGGRASATPSAATKSGRRSTRKPASGTGDEADDAASELSRRSTRTPGAETDVSAQFTATRPTARRKTRLSDFDTSAIVKEEADEEVDRRRTNHGESPFSLDNPFQRGSPPTSGTETKRKTGVRNSTGTRRRTEHNDGVGIKPEDDETPVSRSKKTALPLSRHANGKTKVDRQRNAMLEPGEEFTPEGQEEIEREEESTGKRVMHTRQKRPKSNAAKTGPWIVLTTLLAGFGGWWRQEKIAAGYCGIGSSGQTTALSNSNVQLPEWASALQPRCEPCPQHAYCYPDFEARCEPDFLLQNHPLSLGGLLPLAPTCEPDGEKVRKVKAVADRAVEELREQKAKYECGIKDENGSTVKSPEVPEETLKAKVGAKRRRGMTEIEFDNLWNDAIGEVLGREEVTRHSNGLGSTSINTNRLLSSSSLARLPLTCSARRSVRVTLARHRVPLALVMTLMLSAAYARHRILLAGTDKARVPGLVRMVLDRLATQAALAEEGRTSEGWLSAGQLRDDVLRDEFSAERRERIWKRVKAVVEVNANVRAGVKEGKSGEVSRVWEWIGALPALENGYDRRRSGRFSLGMGSENDSAVTSRDPSRAPSPGGKGEDMVEARRWDEGRPVY